MPNCPLGGAIVNRTYRIVSVSITLLAIQIIVSAQNFSRTDYPLLGNNHIVADLNGDGRSDVALPIIDANPGLLSNSGGGQYRGELSSSTNPQNITVRSSLGGVATANVVAR